MGAVLIGRSRSAGALIVSAVALMITDVSPGSARSGSAELPVQAVRVIGLRWGGDAATTRLVIDLDKPVASSVSIAADPAKRVLVSFSRTVTFDLTSGAGRGAVKAWRVRQSPSGTRLALDLANDAKVLHRFLLPPIQDDGPYRLVIDIVADSATVGPEISTPVAPSARVDDKAPVAERPIARPGSVRSLKVVVVDAGHGGHDPGAQSPTHNEKDVTLAAALVLKKRLEQTGRYRVVLTRATDTYIPLETRVRIARKAGADLFISLHADSAGADPATHGASIYTLSDHGETRVSTVLGQHEWFSRAGKRSDPAVGQILLDLTQNSTRNRSSIFAGLLLEKLSDRVDLLPRSHRDAGYFVLLAPDVPAALLEMGFISNPKDETRLTDSTQRRRLMDGVAAAIDSYFAGPIVVASR